jgi:general secretion pathway protein G
MKKSKNAFTMIELVFVIVVLGILAAIAVPRLAATRADAEITKGRADVASIRSAIITERQGRLIAGDSDWIENGTGADQMDEGGLFGGVLMYTETNKVANGHWSATAGSGTYVFKVNNVDNTFTYNDADGTFKCTSGSFCDELTD